MSEPCTYPVGGCQLAGTIQDLQARHDEMELAYLSLCMVIHQAAAALDNKLPMSAKAMLTEALKPTPREKGRE